MKIRSATSQKFLTFGILFGPGANVNVSSLLATTANIANSDFMSGNYHFVQDPNNSNSVINQGRIQVADGGFVALEINSDSIDVLAARNVCQ